MFPPNPHMPIGKKNNRRPISATATDQLAHRERGDVAQPPARMERQSEARTNYVAAARNVPPVFAQNPRICCAFATNSTSFRGKKFPKCRDLSEKNSEEKSLRNRKNRRWVGMNTWRCRRRKMTVGQCKYTPVKWMNKSLYMAINRAAITVLSIFINSRK